MSLKSGDGPKFVHKRQHHLRTLTDQKPCVQPDLIEYMENMTSVDESPYKTGAMGFYRQSPKLDDEFSQTMNEKPQALSFGKKARKTIQDPSSTLKLAKLLVQDQ